MDMPTQLSKETALTLSLGTICVVGVSVIGGVIWANNKLHEIDGLKQSLIDHGAIIESLQNDIAGHSSSIASALSGLQASHCRDEKLKSFVRQITDTMDKLTIASGGAPQLANSLVRPQLDGIRSELHQWNC
jgi:hypothetical protein